MELNKNLKIVELGYLKYLLKKNPFALLSSEGIEQVLPLHVDTRVDAELSTIIGSWMKNRERGLLFITGEFGSGKTHRLKLIKELASGLPCYYIKVDVETLRDLIARTLSLIREERITSKIELILGSRRTTTANLEDAIEELLSKLNQNEYNLLLFDELENTVMTGSNQKVKDIAGFIKRLYTELKGAIIIACIPPAFHMIAPHLRDVPYKHVRMKGVSNEEAELIIARRIQVCREDLVKNGLLESTYPFSKDAIYLMNELAGGNPRRLLKYARSMLTISVLSDLAKGGTIDSSKIMKNIPVPRSPSDREENHRDLPPEVRKLLSHFGESSFSTIEASKVLGRSISECKYLLDDLVRKSLLMREGPRYRVISSPFRQTL